MASDVTVPNNFTVATPAVADDVDANFAAIVSWINTNAVHLDAAKAFSAVPSGPATDPTSANELARKAYVDAGDVGTICSVRRAAVQAVAGGSTQDDITFDTEDADASGFIAVPAVTLTVPAGKAGLYSVGMRGTVSASSPSTIRLYLFINGVATPGVCLLTNVTDAVSPGITVWLAVGDTLKIQAYNGHASSLNFTARLNLARISVT